MDADFWAALVPGDELSMREGARFVGDAVVAWSAETSPPSPAGWAALKEWLRGSDPPPAVPPPWASSTIRIAEEYLTGRTPLRALFEAAATKVDEPIEFQTAVLAALSWWPDSIESWLDYSADKRGTPSSFFERTPYGYRVGDYGPHGLTGLQTFEDEAEACAEFIYRDARRLLGG